MSLSTKKRDIEIFDRDYVIILTLMRHEKLTDEAETFHYLIELLNNILIQNTELRAKVNQQIADFQQDFVR